MADKLVFDLSSEVEGSPQVFVRKDWVKILDNMNTNYNSNQTIIDTSQLSNSNKFFLYREAYLMMPLLLTLTGPARAGSNGFAPATAAISVDYAMGFKNWFGTMIHSMTLDMNGTTIVQQTPFINMVNSFRLLTTLSLNDVTTQGATIGFYPDNATAFSVNAFGQANAANTASVQGAGVCNNSLFPCIPVKTVNGLNIGGAETSVPLTGQFSSYDSDDGNIGLVKRIQFINLDPDGIVGTYGLGNAAVPTPVASTTYSQIIAGGTPLGGGVGGSSGGLRNLWKSHISTKVNGGAGGSSMLQISVSAIVYLKHMHPFFSMIPLLKGTFFKMTCFLNNTSVTQTISEKVIANDGTARTGVAQLTGVSNAVGGVCPLMLTGTSASSGGCFNLGNGNYIGSMFVGATCLNSTQNAINNTGGVLSKSVYLYVPSYTFNPVFESAYLSSPVKTINYTDYYQYQVSGVGPSQPFNNLITNGIANIKSVLIIPYLSSTSGSQAAPGTSYCGLPAGSAQYQSPYDCAGAGSTAPFALFTQFNVVISGQNAIYNTEQYAFEHFADQFKGCNSVNGDMTDGLTSGLIGQLDWESSQCFYYTNVGRQLPVEEAVPKSVQIQGINQSQFTLDLFVFIEYGCSLSVDVLSGARV
jgi:hypothetical protein